MENFYRKSEIPEHLQQYFEPAEIGLEETPELFVAKMVEVFTEVRRVLKKEGTLWLNLGDSYAGSGRGLMGDGTPSDRKDAKQGTNKGTTTGVFKNRTNEKTDDTANSLHNRQSLLSDGFNNFSTKPKDLIGIPWLVAFALRSSGWYLRQDIIWHKPNPMPESVTDRCTKAHEYIFLLSKSQKYYYDHEAIKDVAATAGMKGGFTSKGESGYQSVAMGRKPSGNQIPENAARYIRPDFANKRSVWTVTTKPFTASHESYHWHRVSSGVPSDGMRRIVSSNCPVHGCSDHRVSTQLYDARGAGELIRKQCKSDCHDQEQLCGFSPIEKIHAYYFGEHSLDYSQQLYLLSANQHSNENHRTGHDPLTNQPCTSFVQILSDIEHTSEQHEIFGLAGRILLSKTLPDDLDDHLWVEILYHNVSKSSFDDNCLCAIYERKTKKHDHFATFPEDLIVDCIKAGCPEGGIVLDPFMGAGTTALVASKLNRDFIGFELNPAYIEIAKKRLQNELGMFNKLSA